MPEISHNRPVTVARAEDDEAQEAVLDIDDIDLQALAEEVYRLLRHELRLERERQGRPQQWFR